MADTSLTSRGERTREAILDAAERLILEQGYHGTSMRQIAEAAEIAVGGIYNHFVGKKAIFEALLERHQPYTDIGERLARLEAGTAKELVDRAVRMVTAQALSDLVFIRLMFVDLQEFNGDTVFPFAMRLVHELVALIGRLVATGEVREDIPTPVLVRTFASLVVFYALSEVIGFRGGAPRPELPALLRDSGEIDWIGGMVDIYLHGILKRQD